MTQNDGPVVTSWRESVGSKAAEGDDAVCEKSLFHLEELCSEKLHTDCCRNPTQLSREIEVGKPLKPVGRCLPFELQLERLGRGG